MHPKQNRRPFKKEREHRINSEINVPQVRLVGENLEPGVYPTDKALILCQQLEVDLVEISPQADPPVCRAVDYNKFLYEKKRKEKEMKAKGKPFAKGGGIESKGKAPAKQVKMMYGGKC